MFADLNNLMLCLLLFVNFVVADPDYLSYKYAMYKADEEYEYKTYFTLRVCDDESKIMRMPYNSTHIEKKVFSDEKCTQPVSYEYIEASYLDDIESIIANSYAFLEWATTDHNMIVITNVYPHQFCNTIRSTVENHTYIDYSNGYFYAEWEPINDELTVFPECTHATPGMIWTWRRTKADTWNYQHARIRLGGKGEEICNGADPLALVVVFIIGLLSF